MPQVVQLLRLGQNSSIEQDKKEPDSELVEKVKVETPIETTKESAQAFLDLAKEKGKVTENE